MPMDFVEKNLSKSRAAAAESFPLIVLFIDDRWMSNRDIYDVARRFFTFLHFFFYIPNRFDRKDRSVYDVQEERQVNNLYTGTRAAACEGGCPPASFFHA